MRNMLTVDELESLLFVAGDEGLSVSFLASSLELSEEYITRMYIELQSLCQSSSRPYNVISAKGVMSLVTKSQYSDIIARVRVHIDKQPLTKSHIEVLSVLLYNGPSTKVDIDAFRGVNSGQALRSLSLRGMVEKSGTSHGSTIFQASSDVLHMLGVTSSDQLPQFKQLQKQLQDVNSKSD